MCLELYVLLDFFERAVHSKYPLQIPPDALFKVVIEVDHAEGKYKQVILSTVAH